jgi:hypothetical protein
LKDVVARQGCCDGHQRPELLEELYSAAGMMEMVVNVEFRILGGVEHK